MALQIKTVNRNIVKSEKCRCKYGKPIKFDILQVNITYNGETSSYQIDAKHLSPDKDSIYFYPSIENGQLEIQWNEDVADYIHRIQVVKQPSKISSSFSSFTSLAMHS